MTKSRILAKGYMKGSLLLIAINVEGYGWKVLDIPATNRTAILKKLDKELQLWRNDSHYRNTIGFDSWLSDVAA